MPTSVLDLIRRRPLPSDFPSLDELGRTFPDYRGAIDRDAGHDAIANFPVEGGLIRSEIPGFLRPADALALYDLARRAQGDVLQIGAAWGLSASILCRAVADSGRSARVVSVEIDPNFCEATRAAIAGLGLDAFHEIRQGDGTQQADRLIAEGRRFGFVFIDHDHAYAPTRAIGRRLARLVEPGGLILFHDFNDERNRTEPDLYGVYRGVREIVGKRDFRFELVIGCCALVRRIRR